MFGASRGLAASKRKIKDRSTGVPSGDIAVTGLEIQKMPNDRIRARVKRMINGQFRLDDMMETLLFLREHNDGMSAVAEIGDFVAHQNERNRGITTKATQEWFTVVRFHMPRFRSGEPHTYHGNRLPPSTDEYLKIAVNRVGANVVRAKTGIKGRTATKILADLTKRMSRNSDGTWALPNDCTPREIDLINCVTSLLVVKPAFDANTLFHEFIAILKSNGLLTKEDVRANADSLNTLLQLYTVSLMHKCIVRIDADTTVELKASANKIEKCIEVLCAVPRVSPELPNVGFQCSIFTANVDPAKHCHTELLERSDWDCEIELGPDKMLAVL